jgi:hypothetical protein
LAVASAAYRAFTDLGYDFITAGGHAMFTSLRSWINWIGNDDRWAKTRRMIHRTVGAQQRTMRFERLEERSLLSTFDVLNLADSGGGSLRAAVLAAEANPGADVIQFAKHLNGTITLTTGELLISTDLSIQGLGANRLTVSGNDASRIFNVMGGVDEATAIDVNIAGLKVTRGLADQGAGINHEGFANLSLTRMVISNNLAQAVFSGGGGIRSAGIGAHLEITDSVVANNRVEGLDGSFATFGGGILLDEAAAVINRSTISGNQLISGPEAGTAVGGGIANLNGESLTIISSTIINNRSLGGTGGGEAVGGGIANAGSTLHVRHSIVSGNEARGSDGEYIGQAIGGGISNGRGSSAYISDSLLSGNRAIAGSGGVLEGEDTSVGTAFGGAIIGDVYLEVTRSILVGNQAIGGNNATHIAPTTADVGAAHGGAILVGFGGETLIRDSVILNNKAIGGSGNTGSGPVGFVGTATGGGIDNSLDPAVFGEPSAPPRLEVINSSIIGNEAIGGNNNTGSGVQVFVSAGLGGGVANYLGGVTEISNSLLTGNKAVGGAGGLGAGGGIFNGISVVQLDTGPIFAPSSVTVTKSILALNVARGGPGTPGGDGLGGGAYNDADSTLTLEQSAVTLNRALGAESGGQGIGGGIYNLGTLIVDALTLIRKNHASTSNDNILG